MDTSFYSEARQAFFKELTEVWRVAAHVDPMLSKIKRVTFDHGSTNKLVDLQGVKRSTELAELGGEFRIPKDRLEAGDIEAFEDAIKKGVRQLREGITKLLIDTASQAATESGNVIDLRGRPLTGAALCDLIERLEIDFDEQAQPIVPTLHLSPELHDQVRELLQRPEVQLRLDMILRAKWLERYALKL